jgi:hypothetical protein
VTILFLPYLAFLIKEMLTVVFVAFILPTLLIRGLISCSAVNGRELSITMIYVMVPILVNEATDKIP